jgi:hypothetical protein
MSAKPIELRRSARKAVLGEGFKDVEGYNALLSE